MIKDRNGRMRESKKRWKAVVISMCLLCICVIIFDKNEVLLNMISTKHESLMNNGINVIRTADESTVDSYNEFMTENGRISGRYNGRIWTDKSVYSYNDTAGSVSLDNGKFSIEFNNGEKSEDFLTVFSALGSSQIVTGKVPTPTDVMIIIDASSSMGNAEKSDSRISLTISAADKAVKKLMESNPNARVGIVLFDDNAFVLAPLGRYTPTDDTHIDKNDGLEGDNISTEYTYLKAEGQSGDYTITFTYKEADGSENIISKRCEGGTNHQAAYYVGMSMLEQAQDLDVIIDGVSYRRMPSVIMFTDGAAGEAGDYSTWWAPSRLLDIDNTDQNENWHGTQNISSEVRVMKTLLTASFMKKAVERHYGQLPSVYTIGLQMRDITAKMVLDPR